jgi:hypothetical protein
MKVIILQDNVYDYLMFALKEYAANGLPLEELAPAATLYRDLLKAKNVELKDPDDPSTDKTTEETPPNPNVAAPL